MTATSFYDKKCKKVDQNHVEYLLKNARIRQSTRTSMLALAVIHYHLTLIHKVHCHCHRLQKKKLGRLIRWKCQLAAQAFRELGNETMFRWAYRMTKEQFNDLFKPIEKKMQISAKSHRVTKQAPNGPIENIVRLACAIRYFAGGRRYDICSVFGISHLSFYEQCVWIVIDAIHRCDKLNIQYPSSHDEQKKIAEGFRKRSSVGINVCAGAIDGLLVWTEKPNPKHCEKQKCGPHRYFCGCKGKFGYNLQAICDSECHFLEVWIKNPAASSDFISFVHLDFYAKVTEEQNPTFMWQDLALFGDNAYVQMKFMIVPYKGA